MKTLLTTFLFSCVVFATTAQELKKVKHNLTSNPFTEEKEEYEVLKSDKKIKYGTYQRWFNGKLVETGFYKDNQKDSTWSKFHSYSGAIRERGNYAKDERTGMWQFYNYKNQLEYSYDFTIRKLLSVNEETISKTAWVVTDTASSQTTVEHPALFMGGTAASGEILARNMRFPAPAMRMGIQGRVYVTFVIDENGRASGHKVSKPLDKDCDEEALRVCRMLTEWIPASKDGKPVKSLHVIPVSFNFGGIIR